MRHTSRKYSAMVSRVATTTLDVRIIRFAIKGYSIREIAERVGVSKSTVQRRIASVGLTRQDWEQVRGRPTPPRRQTRADH